MNPYLKAIYVLNNYKNKNFLIDFTPKENETFRHLILTGINGSGKTTVLKSISLKTLLYKTEQLSYHPDSLSLLTSESMNHIKTDLENLSFPFVELKFINENIDFNKLTYIYIPTIKMSSVKPVNSTDRIDFVNKIDNYYTSFKNLDFISRISYAERTIKNLVSDTKKNGLEPEILSLRGENLSNLYSSVEIPRLALSESFEQFLGLLKDEQAYALADNEIGKAEALTKRFEDLEKSFQILFEEPELKLKHQFRGGRKFYFELPEGRITDFNQLSHGHNAVLTILAEIMLNIEAYREQNPDDVNPKGIVVIDEIESHLHLSLQEKILPVLTQMFPQMQFIVATHSPAVISSIENATIYDLSKQIAVNENLTGIPYNVLVENHFGVSEYSLAVTKKLTRVKELINNNAISEQERKELEKNVNDLQNLSPDLALDVHLELERRRKNGKL